MSVERLLAIEKLLSPLPNKITTIRAVVENMEVGICNVFQSHKDIFVCLHPSSSSYDGEFRKGLILIEQFEHFYSKYGELLGDIEESLVDMLSDGALNFKLITNGDIPDIVDNLRLPIRAFAAGMLVCFERVKGRYMPNYYNNEHIKLMELLYSKIKMPTLNETLQERLYNDFTVHKTDYDELVDEIYCICQKILPLSKYSEECKLYKRQKYEELIVSNKIRQFIIREKKYDSFSFVFGMSEFDNLLRDFYENKHIRKKYEDSDHALDLLKKIEAVDSSAYVENDKVKGFINKYFGELSLKLDDVKIFLKTNLIYTNMSICIFTNFMGRTLGDIALAHSMAKYGTSIPAPLKPHIEVFRNVAAFRYCVGQVLIDLVYLEQLDILHGDMHFNNLTIRPFAAPEIDELCANDVKIRLPAFDFRIGVIDFSRGLDLQCTSRSKQITIDTIYHYIAKIDAKFFDNHKGKLAELTFVRLFAVGRLFDYLFVLKSFNNLFVEKVLNMTLVDPKLEAEIKAEIKNVQNYVLHVLLQPGDKYVYRRYINNNFKTKFD